MRRESLLEEGPPLVYHSLTNLKTHSQGVRYQNYQVQLEGLLGYQVPLWRFGWLAAQARPPFLNPFDFQDFVPNPNLNSLQQAHSSVPAAEYSVLTRLIRVNSVLQGTFLLNSC